MRYCIFAVISIAFLCEVQCFYWPHFGRCPSLEVQQNFDIDNYMDEWYLLCGYHVEEIQGKGRCATATYSHVDNTILVYNHQISTHNKSEDLHGTAVQVNPSLHDGRFLVTFNLTFWGPVTAPYWVLGTDYFTYSVVYGCENFLFFFHFYSIWVLSRDQTFADSEDKDEFYRKVGSVLMNSGLCRSILTPHSQEDCDV